MNTDFFWQPFELKAAPAASGIYAIKSGACWLYIGLSQNIAIRLKQRHHPAQISQGLTSLPRQFYWHPTPVNMLRKVEARLIKQHHPLWNGGTDWEALSQAPCCNFNKYGVTAEQMKLAISPGGWLD